MLENKVIVYDDSCPMCRLYTYWFVAWGFLKAENRVGFANAPSQITEKVDLDRGRHEIPLVDRESRETIYGLQALTFILASRWKWLAPIFRTRVFWSTFHPLYQIITYNRRVIAGCRACSGFDCAPDLNRFYRSVYLVLAAAFATLISIQLLRADTAVATTGFSLIAAFAAVCLIVGTVKRGFQGSQVAWNYIGNQVTILVIVSTILIPLLVFTPISTSLGWTIVFVALLLGLEEVQRRTQLS